MEKFSNLGIIIPIVIGFLFLGSYEKTDINKEDHLFKIEQKEGYKSTTSTNDDPFHIIESEITRPVVKMHFEKDVPQKEAMLQFDNAVHTYITNNALQHQKGFGTEWVYRLWVKTGTKINNQTTGCRGAYIQFTTSAGSYRPTFNQMDDAGDNLDGGYDAYLFVASFPDRAIKWVEVDNGRLYLKGTDGWFVEEFICQLLSKDQAIATTGSSGFWTHPNVWLDNDKSTNWDNFYCSANESRRLNF